MILMIKEGNGSIVLDVMKLTKIVLTVEKAIGKRLMERYEQTVIWHVSKKGCGGIVNIIFENSVEFYVIDVLVNGFDTQLLNVRRYPMSYIGDELF